MSSTAVTYRAVQATSPGRLELVRKPLVDPQPGYVRIRVEACGVCHPTRGRLRARFRSLGREFRDTRRWV